MAHLTIDRYITTQYENWLSYARYQCFLKRIGDVADEVLSDAVLVLLSKSEQTIIGMINERHSDGRHLDFFMFVTIQYKCMNRWKKRHVDRQTKRDIDINQLNIKEFESEDYIEYDTYGKMRQMQELWPLLNVSELSKKIFEFVVLEGGSTSDCGRTANCARMHVYKVKKAIRQAVGN